ncbi:C-type lectin-like [Trinorchestia longiramus]|nr:C-type lectin-like [Trinorchestia longiramus]
MRLTITAFVVILHFVKGDAGSEDCGRGWRTLSGGRCVGRGSELHAPSAGGSAQSFEGAQGACVLSNASLLVISVADISALLALTGWGDTETYFWVGGVDDQTTTSESSDEILQQTGENEDDTVPCWAARFQESNEFLELTRAPCETTLDFICQKAMMLPDCTGSHCEQMRKARVKRQVHQDPFQASFGDVLSVASIGDCVYASPYSRGGGGGAWFAEDCNAARSMLCEYPRKVGAKLSVPASSSAIFSPCADEWSYNSKTHSCYKLMKHGGQTQAVAESNCQLFGGHLVSIGSQDEADFIRKVVQSSNFAYTTFWVGLQQTENGHEWLDGSDAVFLQWRRGQPNSHQGREACTTAYKRTMELSDTYCQAYFSYMCKAPSGMSKQTPVLKTVTPALPCPTTEGWVLHKDNCYKVFSKRDSFFKTWDQARLHCRKNHAHLASIQDEEENAFMISQVYTLPDEVLWLGGHASNDVGYSWTDGSPFLFINWKMGEPNNLHDQESCLSMYPGDEAYWNDDNCGMLAGWVCKKPAFESSTSSTTTTSGPVGLCDQGWVNTGKKCIKLYEEAKTFEDARQTCKMESLGADLVSIAGKKDQAVMSALVGPVDRGVWLGMAYTDVYRWVDQSPVHYTNWAPGEPNNNYLTRNKAIVSGPSFNAGNRRVFVLRGLSNSLSLRNLFMPHMLEIARSMASSPPKSLARERVKRSSRDERKPEDCVEMHNNIRGNKWNDIQCEVLLPFVCQKPLDPSIESSGVPAACDKPFASYMNYSGACYRYVKEAHSWQDAEAQCRSEGAELASIETISQNSYVYLLAETEGPQKVWIGFRYVNSSDRFEWSDGHPTLYSNWAAEEPRVEGGSKSELCVALSPQEAGEWHVEDCNETRPFICKYRQEIIPTPDTPVQGSCPNGQWADLGGSFCYYVDEKDHFTWNRANAQCKEMSAELVSIHSSVEMNYMARLVAHHHVSLWTGLMRGSETFTWSDGSPYDYTHWAPFEPNGADEKCVEMLLAERVWNDISCNVLRGFVCKISKTPYPESTIGPERTATLEKLSQRQETGSQLGNGGVVALVLASLVMVVAISYVLYTYRNHLRTNRPAVRLAATTSFDNALYNPDSLEDPILGNIETGARAAGAVTLSVGPS